MGVMSGVRRVFVVRGKVGSVDGCLDGGLSDVRWLFMHLLSRGEIDTAPSDAFVLPSVASTELPFERPIHVTSSKKTRCVISRNKPRL